MIAAWWMCLWSCCRKKVRQYQQLAVTVKYKHLQVNAPSQDRECSLYQCLSIDCALRNDLCTVSTGVTQTMGLGLSY